MKIYISENIVKKKEKIESWYKILLHNTSVTESIVFLITLQCYPFLIFKTLSAV